eukprot:scaffold56666_cov57-Phaeocystis_antarctica.AAC.1
MRRAKEVLLGDAVYVSASRAVHAKLLRPRGVGARLGRRGAVVRGSLALLLARLLAFPLALPASAAVVAALLDISSCPDPTPGTGLPAAARARAATPATTRVAAASATTRAAAASATAPTAAAKPASRPARAARATAAAGWAAGAAEAR